MNSRGNNKAQITVYITATEFPTTNQFSAYYPNRHPPLRTCQ